MEVDDIRTGFSEFLHIFFRLHNHQMCIKNHIAVLSDALNHRNPKGNIGNKNPIHHIQMDILCACVLNQL